jgi:ADP-ribosylglycohydrolase
VAEGAGLENRYTGNGIEGSNPSLSVPRPGTSHLEFRPPRALTQQAVDSAITAGLADALEGALLGLALGDALGFVVESQSPRVAREYVNDLLRSGRAGARAHPAFPFGQYSDDTQLARELLLSVRESNGWDPARFAARVAALVLAGGDVGAGPGTRGSGLRHALGAPWEHAGATAPYAGNGAAMRAGPAGLLFGGDAERWRHCVREQSRVTHQDPRSMAGAMAIAGAVALARATPRLDPPSLLDDVASWVECEDESMAAVVRGLATWRHLEPAAAAAYLGVSEQGVSPCVVTSVLWSLYAFLRSPDDYWESICVAIAVGGDTDTTAAMTGAIAGGRLGTAALPSALLERLTDRGTWSAVELGRLARDCARIQ